ncbi:MAG TPA: hypothetical protein VKA95_06415 [Nitrososphaeraceae archaeon]|nr:hypothetical protein [Nitrososphaeraceae archaeon]
MTNNELVNEMIDLGIIERVKESDLQEINLSEKQYLIRPTNKFLVYLYSAGAITNICKVGVYANKDTNATINTQTKFTDDVTIALGELLTAQGILERYVRDASKPMQDKIESDKTRKFFDMARLIHNSLLAQMCGLSGTIAAGINNAIHKDQLLSHGSFAQRVLENRELSWS